MILYAKCIVFFMPNPSNGIVVEVSVCDLEMIWQRFLFHSETMVLGCNLNSACSEIFNRLIRSTVPKL